LIRLTELNPIEMREIRQEAILTSLRDRIELAGPNGIPWQDALRQSGKKVSLFASEVSTLIEREEIFAFIRQPTRGRPGILLVSSVYRDHWRELLETGEYEDENYVYKLLPSDWFRLRYGIQTKTGVEI